MSTTVTAPAAPAPGSGPRMSLASVVSTKKESPPRVVLYGPEGVGKSTFGSYAPSPIFIASESGLTELDVKAFPEPKTWADVLEAVQQLTVGQHEYKTLVIDTLDWLEPLLWRQLCVQNNWTNGIETPGFGKGYTAAADHWRIFISRLSELREKRGMGVVFLAHSRVKNFKNPEGDDYERYQLKIDEKAAGVLKEWCDAVLFANYETVTATNKAKRITGLSTGARFMHTVRMAAFDAKNRYSLPERMPFSWADFAAGVAAGQVAPTATLLEEIRTLLPLLDAASQATVTAWLEKPANVASAPHLAQMLDRMRAKHAIQNPPTDSAGTQEIKS